MPAAAARWPDEVTESGRGWLLGKFKWRHAGARMPGGGDPFVAINLTALLDADPSPRTELLVAVTLDEDHGGYMVLGGHLNSSWDHTVNPIRTVASSGRGA